MKILLISLLALGSSIGQAAPIPDLVKFLHDEIGRADDAVHETAPASGVAANSVVDTWYFKNFWLRIRLPLGFKIPGALKITVIPEAELLWQRANPEGWSTYRP